MDYHRRYRQDGSCEIICTECFSTIGTALNARAAEALEAGHLCPKKINRAAAGEAADQGTRASAICAARNSVQRFLGISARHRMYLPIAALAAILLVYVLPTAAE